jgi:hypothetical protein
MHRGNKIERLSVILYQDAWQPWIDDRRNGDAVKFMLRPFTAENMEYYRVSPLANNARNDSPEFLKPSAASNARPAAPLNHALPCLKSSRCRRRRIRHELNCQSWLFAIDGDRAAGADLSVKFQRVVKHLDVEGFFLAVQFEIFWYPP